MTGKIKELQVDLGNGIVVRADVSSVADVLEVLGELSGLAERAATFEPGADLKASASKNSDQSGTVGQESPEALVELRAGLEAGVLRKSTLLGFKDGVPQLMRPTAFGSVSDAALALLYAVEVGLKKNSLEFDAFKGLYDAQNIKSGSPVSMLLNNMKNSGYVDSKLYASERKVRLTAKGEQKAIEVLKAMAVKQK